MSDVSGMTADPARAGGPGGRSARAYRLRVTSYDRTSSLLIALLIMVGMLVAGLIIVYVTRQLIDLSVTKTVTLTDAASRPADAAMGLKRDLEPPGLEDAPELTEPDLPDTLQALTSATASMQAILDDISIVSDVEAGRGKGFGDNRRAGTGGEGADERVAREDRWRIRYDDVPSHSTYARQLDFFHIELATWGQDNRVHYAYNLSQGTPDTRIGDPDDEKRIRMAWVDGALQEADKMLAEKAQIARHGRYILQFMPPEVEALLLRLELEHAKGRDVNDINKTVFIITEAGDGYTFQVVEQQYRYYRGG